MGNFRTNKLVSIIIPVYNGDKYLFDSLSSAVHQSYENIEIIVIDDGSSKYNNYRPILNHFKNYNVKYIKKKKNSGVSSVMNFAIKNAKGYYINWLSHDDLFHPLKIEKQIEIIKKNKSNDLVCCCHSITFNQDTKYSRKIKLNKYLINSPNWLLTSDSLHGCSLLIPRHLILSVGLFNKDLKFTQDYDMWIRLFDYGAKFILCDDYLLFSRKHYLQDSITKIDKVNKEKKDLYFEKLSKFINANSFSSKSLLSIFNIFFSFIYRGYFFILFNFIKKYKTSKFVFNFILIIIFILVVILGAPIFFLKKLLISFFLKINLFKYVF